MRAIARGRHSDLQFLHVTLSPRLEASLQQKTSEVLASSLGLDPRAASGLPRRAARRAWLEALSRVVDEQCARVADLAWGACDDTGEAHSHPRAAPSVHALPGDNISLPPAVRAQLHEHVQQLQFLCHARLEDGQDQARRLYPGLTACARAVYQAVEKSHRVVRVFEEPLFKRLEWFHKQGVALGRDLTYKRLQLQEKRAAAGVHARNVSVLREAMSLYGNPYREPHKSRALSSEIRKLLLDPDDDGLGPVLVVLRSQRQVNREDRANYMATLAGLDAQLEELNVKISLLKRRLAELAAVDYEYGPRIAELMARLLDGKEGVAVQVAAMPERDEAGDRQSQTLQVFQKSMEARSPEARRKQQGRTGLFYVEDVHGGDDSNRGETPTKAGPGKKEGEGDDRQRTLLKKPVFQRHYESIVTVPALPEGQVAGAGLKSLSLAPAEPSGADPVPLLMQRIRARAPHVPPSDRPDAARAPAHLVPGERPLRDAAHKAPHDKLHDKPLSGAEPQPSDQPYSDDWLFDLSVALPTELRFDTHKDRQRFEELFGITLGDRAPVVPVETATERAWREGLPDSFLELAGGGREGGYDVVVPLVKPMSADLLDNEGDDEEKEREFDRMAVLAAYHYDPVAPPDYHKNSFSSPLLRREKK